MRYPDGSYDSDPFADRVVELGVNRFGYTVTEPIAVIELGERVGGYWFMSLEDENDIQWYGEQAALEAMVR